MTEREKIPAAEGVTHSAERAAAEPARPGISEGVTRSETPNQGMPTSGQTDPTSDRPTKLVGMYDRPENAGSSMSMTTILIAIALIVAVVLALLWIF